MEKLRVAAALKKRWVRIALGVAGLFIVVVNLAPFLISADAVRPMLQEQLSSALGRRVTLGHLSFSLLSSSLDANNIAIADDPAFSSSPFLQAKSLHIGVKIGAFLFSRQVSITKLTIDSPAIQLIQSQKGVWNFSSIGGATANPAPQQQSAIPDLTVGEMSIKDGSATVSSIPSTGKSFVYSKVNLTMTGFSFAKSFPFQLSASLPGDGSFSLKGAAGPLATQNSADTPFNATLQLKHFDPVAAGIVDAGKGIGMVADFDGQLASDGKSLTSSGKIKAAQLKLAASGSPSTKPFEMDYNVSTNLDAGNLDSRSGQVTDIALHAGSVALHLTGSFTLATEAVTLDLHLAAPNLPIDQLEQLLPVVGVHLPSGSSLKGGTLTANLAITGPVTAPTIAGPMEIDNTTLAGFDLGSKIGGLTDPGGNNGSGGTAVQYLKTTVTSTSQSTQFASIDASIPAIGTATGSGAVSASGALNFNLKANVKGLSGITGAASEATTQVKGMVGGLFGKKAAAQTPAKSKSSGGIPLTITGTASNPTIRANLKAMLE